MYIHKFLIVVQLTHNIILGSGVQHYDLIFVYTVKWSSQAYRTPANFLIFKCMYHDIETSPKLYIYGIPNCWYLGVSNCLVWKALQRALSS